jgi:hypothetical protein
MKAAKPKTTKLDAGWYSVEVHGRCFEVESSGRIRGQAGEWLAFAVVDSGYGFARRE